MLKRHGRLPPSCKQRTATMVMRSQHNSFDPQVHITAGQLRRLGVYLSELIPNDAFVRRVAVGVKDDDVLAEKAVRVRVLEPFHLAA